MNQPNLIAIRPTPLDEARAELAAILREVTTDSPSIGRLAVHAERTRAALDKVREPAEVKASARPLSGAVKPAPSKKEDAPLAKESKPTPADPAGPPKSKRRPLKWKTPKGARLVDQDGRALYVSNGYRKSAAEVRVGRSVLPSEVDAIAGQIVATRDECVGLPSMAVWLHQAEHAKVKVREAEKQAAREARRAG